MAHVRVRLAPVLAALAGGDPRVDVEVHDGGTVGDLLSVLDHRFPALARRVRDEQGRVRRHVNVFVEADNIRDRDGLETTLAEGVEVTILPAISGGASRL